MDVIGPVILFLATAASAGEEVTYVHTDALGSPVAETDQAGNVIARYRYEPYGSTVDGFQQDGVGYAGHVHDSQTGMSYMQQRYYSPEIGAFLSVDPVTAHSGKATQFNR